jgi:hypothetical protein
LKIKGKISIYIVFPFCLIILTAGCISSTTQEDVAAPTDDSLQSFDEFFESETLDLSLSGENINGAILLYQGHGSLRITTAEEKVISIDPAGEGYDAPADLIWITHPHQDHTAIERIETQNPNSLIITHEEALVDGKHKTFELDFVTVEAVEAGNNPNHDINICVGYILALPDGISIYISEDTSKTEQMGKLAERNLDYAFFCSDGRYNMDYGGGYRVCHTCWCKA